MEKRGDVECKMDALWTNESVGVEGEMDEPVDDMTLQVINDDVLQRGLRRIATSGAGNAEE
eukprot:3751885-Heterocapsa_arctica.AAC.1